MGRTVIIGVDKALSTLKHCSGYWKGIEFVDISDELDIWAVHNGITVDFDGDRANVRPVLRVRGRYLDFVLLETPSLGILTCSSRVANNVYESLIAARGRSLLFFPVRIPRSALIDFKNDSITDMLDVLDTIFAK